jgi:hypothetical protein
VFLQNANFPTFVQLSILLWEQYRLFIFAYLSFVSMQFFLIIVKLVLLLIIHNAFVRGRETANQQSIENLTTTAQPLQETGL